MDLTVQTPITLPVLPPLVEESLTLTLAENDVPTPQAVINLWVKVLNNARQPDERLELYFNGTLLETRAAAQWSSWEGEQWHLWSRPVLSLGESGIVVELKSFTRSDAPGNKPSLILIGAMEVAGTSLTGGPTVSNSVGRCVYTTPANSAGLSLQGVYPVTAEDLGPGETGQRLTARLGGLGAPRISASIRFDGGVAADEEEGEEEEEGEVEGEDTPSAPLNAYVQLRYGDEAINGRINALLMPEPFIDGVNAFKVGQECWRVYDYIPEHLHSIPLRPEVRISIDPNFPQAFLMVDDFTLTYVTPLLETTDPAWIGRDNLIPNGDFESGTYPFIIESPEGKTTCPMVSDVIKKVSDACRGDYAAVFRFHVPDAYIAYCDVERIIGKNQRATLVITGLNLESINFVALIPEFLGATGLADGNYLRLLPDSAPTFTGDMEELRFSFSFSGPFNVAFNGDTICTDGLASYECAVNGEFKVGMLDACSTLIDTVPPVLRIDSPAGATDASAGSPSVSVVNRVPASPATDFPGNWILSAESLTPKNTASYAVSDMHVFVNPGSRQDVPFSLADGADPAVLSMNVSARFVDLSPSLDGVIYPVTLSGFYATEDRAGRPTEFPGNRRGTARWNTSASSALVNSYTQHMASAIDMTATWNVSIPRNTSADYWDYSFKPEATDRAGNFSDTSSLHNITVHWLYRTRARLTDREGILSEPPVMPWKLDSPTLPETGTACRQLARFRLYTLETNGSLSIIASTEDWLDGPLLGSTMMNNGRSFMNTVREHMGLALCLDVIGADETGNVQFIPDNYGTGMSRSHLIGAEVDHVIWVPGQDNRAIDTDVSLELFHENINQDQIIRSYGSALRVPLPPLSQACVERVNGLVRFKNIVPTSGLSRAQSGPWILWKFYRNGTLVATGLAGEGQGYRLLENLLLYGTDTDSSVTAAALSAPLDSNDLTDVPWTRRLVRPRFLAKAPSECVAKGIVEENTYDRLGDEGDPPDPLNPNLPSQRRDEVFYTLTAQTVFVDEIGSLIMDPTPARASFSIYPEVRKRIDTPPVREFSR
jgi:hypothetical protein